MKMKSTLLLWFFLLSALPAKDSGYMILHGTFFIPADTSFKDIYGGSMIMPGMGCGVKLWRAISLFVSADYLSKTGRTVGELQDPTKNSQIFAAAGLEARLQLTSTHDATFRAGVAYIHFTDKAFSETVKGNGIGFLFGSGLNWKMKSFFLAFDVDYLRATATPFTDKVVLGGIKMALGIGRFF